MRYLVLVLTLAGSPLVAVAQQTSATALKIVVLEGEGGVNIIQQKTAVRPLVEVRDRNNLPVPGASVTFTLGSGQPAAFAGGAQTVTVTTNAAGQAAATGLNATGAGKVTIQVQAAHQGQIASAAITQTNFATAAAAAAAGVTAGAAAGSGGAAGAAAGGGAATGSTGGTTAAAAGGAAAGGGGLSATTIAIVGGAVAGGAVVAQQAGVIGGGQASYTGSLSGQYVWTNSGMTDIGTPVVCAHTRSVSGTITIELNEEGTSGRASVSWTHTDQSVSGFRCEFQGSSLKHGVSEAQVGGGPSALSFSAMENVPGNANRSDQYTFNGSISGTTITGTLNWQTRSQTTAASGPFTGTGSITIPVTLTR